MIYMGKSIELKKLISNGNVVYIKHSGMNEPSLSVVQGIYEKYIYLSIPRSFVAGNVIKEQNVSCQFIEGEYEYIIQGKVDDIQVNRPGTIGILVEKVSKYKNNRVFKRYSVNFQAGIFLAGSENDIHAIIKNISILGVGVVSKEYIHKSSIVYLRIATFISNDEPLEFKARVIRAEKNGSYYEYGMEIIDIDDRNKDILDKLIFCLNTNENIFIEDLIK